MPQYFRGSSIYDCIIVGGGVSGLCAATYLARFRRSTVVLDAGKSRLQRIPIARNVPGHPEGIAGADLHERLKRQALRYGANIVSGFATGVSVVDDVFQIEGDISLRGRRLLIATGVELVEPYIQDSERAVRAGLLRYCPICDGFETRGLNVGVFGLYPSSIKEASFLRGYTDRVTLLCEAADGDVNFTKEAKRSGVRAITTPIRSLRAAPSAIEVDLANGERLSFDALYPSLGLDPRSELVRVLGGRLSPNGGVLTDGHQQTSVRGVYAAGDVLEGLDQIASAWGQAAIASTAIHNNLRDLENEERDVGRHTLEGKRRDPCCITSGRSARFTALTLAVRAHLQITQSALGSDK